MLESMKLQHWTRRALGAAPSVPALVVAICVCGSATRVRAAPPGPGLSLTWNDCPGGLSASQDLSYACNGNTDTFQLLCSLVVQQAISGVIGAELVIDLQSSDPVAVPDWWYEDGSGTGGCRAGGFDTSTSFDFSADPGCTDAWGGQGFGGNQGFSVGLPDHPSPTQARIKEVAAVTSSNAVTLSPGVVYGLFKVAIRSDRTTSGPACAGCAESACLVFNSVWIRRLPVAGSDVFISNGSSLGSNWATWQGTGASCVSVPVRRPTWGAIKSLYR